MPVLNRRAFLGGAGALAVSPAFAAVPKSGEVDVVVVGAGAAGIAATRRIVAAGRSVVLLEAAPYVGGRCITDTQTFGVPFDRGAHWIRLPEINPLLKLPREQFQIDRAPRGQRLRIGKHEARESELEDFLVGQVRSRHAIIEAARGKTDISCERALPDDLRDWRSTIEFVLGPYGCGKDLGEVSAYDFAKAEERNGDAICRQGYGALLASLATDLPIALSTVVQQIDWRRGVEVDTDQGHLSARAIIITVSTNMLAAGAIKFVPGLPRSRIDAAHKLSLGSLDTIALELPGNPLDLLGDDVVFEKAKDAQTAALLANVSGTDLCLVTVGGRFGRGLAAQGEAAMVAFALDWLADRYGSAVKKAVKRRTATNWNANPLVGGAISVAAPGAQPARRTLGRPLDDKLWLAGEATHETMSGTVSGAWEAGERAAAAALKELADRTPRRAHPEPRSRRAPRRR